MLFSKCRLYLLTENKTDTDHEETERNYEAVEGKKVNRMKLAAV